jgi:hypothetical protein
MASSIVQQTPPLPPATGQPREAEQIIQQQLARTAWQVKLIDLATSLVLLGAGVLGFLLVVALVDHWLFNLGVVGRLLALAVLVIGVTTYFVRDVLPLVMRSINPTYSARTIEESVPTLKNSLINFLLLRGDRAGVREVVYDAIEQRAAQDIAVVPVDLAVDRSRLIRVGYVLVAIMAMFAGYKILSPKDPFQTVARVIAPWADIARPSRVQISDVSPGDVEVYHGRTVSVSALVSGISAGDAVQLQYSTADGQTVDRVVPMTLAAGGLRHECLLPPESDGERSSRGVRQDMTYRILAGDAVSADYRLTVVAAPTIVVQKVEYAYPAYTNKPPLTAEQQGDVQGIEGTRVTIHALANQPITAAAIEFDPDGNSVAESLSLKFEGNQAWGTFVLQLQNDRATPRHSSYQVRFINERQQWSEQPVLHRIEVTGDLAPEVQILSPTKQRIEVPANGSQKIEVRGIDPDYALSSLRLQGIVGQREVLDKQLLPEAAAALPQATAQYEFRPAEHQLVAGDEMIYWAVAADNRTSPLTGSPEPNTAKSTEYVLRVIAATKSADGASGKTADGDPMSDSAEADKPMEGANPQQGDQKQGGKEPGDNEKGENEKGENEKSGKEPGGQQGKQPDQQSKAGGQKGKEQQSGEQQSGKQKSGEQKPQDQKGQQGDQSQSGSESSGGGSEAGESKSQQQGETQSASGGQSQGTQAGTPQGGQPMSEGAEGAESGSGSTSGQSSGNSDTPSGKDGGDAGDETGNPSGKSSRQGKAHEGELVEEVLNQIKKEQQEAGDQQPGEQPPNPKQGQQPGGQKTGRQQPGQQQPGDSQGQLGQPPGANENQGQPNSPQQPGEPGSQPKPGDAAQNKSPQNNGGQENAGEKNDAQNKPAEGQPGKAGQQSPADSQSPAGEQSPTGQQSPQAGQPRAGEGQPGTEPKSNTGKTPQTGDQQGKTGDKQPEPGENPQSKPDTKLGEGQNKSTDKTDGGTPEGATKTDQGEKQQPGQGEEKKPGAAQTGDEGAGENSTDKTGSGQGQSDNRDRKKDLQSDSSQAKSGDPSSPSGSKKQSDSKGGQSGAQSGGGGKGAGQAAGQEGHDSPGSKSAADEGAGAADQQGKGETGKQGGDQKSTDQKTGKSGSEKGNGSGQKQGAQGEEAGGDQSGQPSDGGEKGSNSPNPKERQKNAPSKATDGTSGAGPVTGGGVEGNRPQVDYGPEGTTPDGDKANLEYARKATDMVLERLRHEENREDSELLDKLGWTQGDLQEFIRRWDSMQKSAEQNPAAARELDESLRSLGLRDPRQKKRSGGATSDAQRDLRDSGNRTAPPSKYRDSFDAFRKGAGR